MELGDIIYYILMILIVVFSVLSDRGKRSAKKNVSESTQPINTKKEIREIIHKKTRQTPPPFPKTVSRENHRKNPPGTTPLPMPREFTSSLDAALQTEGQSAIDSFLINDDDYHYTLAGEEKTLPAANPFAAALSEKNELKKAIIYNEILKRKF